MEKMHYTGIGKTKATPLKILGKQQGWIVTTEDGFFAEPKKTVPTKGEHDFNTCEDCQQSRKDYIKILTKQFNGNGKVAGFPFSPYYSNLLRIKEFNRASFECVPELVADKIIYTQQHIINNKENVDYYEDITDYIEYTALSFGQMPNGCGEPLFISDYFFYISDLITRNEEIDKEKKKRILEFIDAYHAPRDKNTDLNILVSTYERWLKAFPLNISFFAELKPHFENILPILNGSPRVNKYTNFAKVKIHTKSSLVDTLLDITKELFSKINLPELLKQEIITNTQNAKMEINEAKYMTGLAEITMNYSKGELKYVKTIKKWLKLSNNYFKEVQAIINENPPKQIEKSKPELKETELSNKIRLHLGFLKNDCPRKHKQILKHKDFENLIEWSIYYYENDFKTPEILEPIKAVNTNKTYIQLAFKYLFKELHKSSPYPKTLFEFYKSAFVAYSKDKRSNFVAVANKDEVKKLMKIDY